MQIEANELMIEKRPVLVQSVIEESVDVATITMKQGLSLICDLDFPIGLQIQADRVRLRQILINLLSNAIKFTEKGDIVVVGRLVNGFLEMSVRDEGIGISQEFKTKIFSPFVQSDSSITRRYVSAH